MGGLGATAPAWASLLQGTGPTHRRLPTGGPSYCGVADAVCEYAATLVRADLFIGATSKAQQVAQQLRALQEAAQASETAAAREAEIGRLKAYAADAAHLRNSPPKQRPPAAEVAEPSRERPARRERPRARS